VAIDPGSLDPQAAGELAGADQLRLAARVLLSLERHDASGDLLDGLRR
jgi:hypothetical protein